MSETIYNNGMAVLCLYRGDDNISQWGGNPYLSGGTNTEWGVEYIYIYVGMVYMISRIPECKVGRIHTLLDHMI